MPYSKLFRSRWAALLWAGGILWTTVEFVGFAPAQTADNVAVANGTIPPTGDPEVDNNLAIFANVMKDN
jgi:hypothetical protein